MIVARHRGRYPMVDNRGGFWFEKRRHLAVNRRRKMATLKAPILPRNSGFRLLERLRHWKMFGEGPYKYMS